MKFKTMKSIILCFCVVSFFLLSCDNQANLCSDYTTKSLIKDIIAEEITKQAFIYETMDLVADELEMAILYGLITEQEFLETIEDPIRTEFNQYFRGQPNDIDYEMKEVINSVKNISRNHINSIILIRPVEIIKETRVCKCEATLVLNDDRQIDINYKVQETKDNLFVEVYQVNKSISLDHFVSVNGEISKNISKQIEKETEGSFRSDKSPEYLYCSNERCNFYKYTDDKGWVKTGPYVIKGDKLEILDWKKDATMVLAKFINSKGVETSGWLFTSDLTE